MGNLIDYYIKRQNTLPHMGKEIDFVVVNDAALEEMGCKPRNLTILSLRVFRSSPALPSDGTGELPTLLVKLRGEQHIEDWYDAFTRDRDGERLLEQCKKYQRMQARRTARALFEPAEDRRKDPR